jgi:bifunctional non-homologous end joining protein LigD
MPSLDPMLATLVQDPFDGDDWFFEPKWDGVRAAAVCTDETRLISRNRKDITVAYPELATINDHVKAADAILDGEIVAFEDDAPSFEKLQSRMHVRGAAEIQRLMKTIPVVYIVFDVLYLDGRDVTGLPYTERRALLESNVDTTSWLQLSPAVPGTGTAMFEAARAQNLEGVVAKRADSVYEHGRSKAWLKIKTTYEADIVIAGWSEGGGGHNGVLGSIVTSVYEDGALRYTGSVGTGFSDRSRALAQQRLEGLAIDDCPFPASTLKGKRELRFAHWVRPELVAMVEFRQLTTAGKLRAPSFKGLRDDKAPEDCTFEQLKRSAGL